MDLKVVGFESMFKIICKLRKMLGLRVWIVLPLQPPSVQLRGKLLPTRRRHGSRRAAGRARRARRRGAAKTSPRERTQKQAKREQRSSAPKTQFNVRKSNEE